MRSAEDYRDAFAALLPIGTAWPRDPGTVLMLLLLGLSDRWEAVDERAQTLLEVEADPRITYEMLDSWEKAFGLPDECVDEPITLADRRRALVRRITEIGGQSRAFFIELAEWLGYTITITEFRPWMVGVDEVGGELEHPLGLELVTDTGANLVTDVGETLVTGPAGAPVVGQYGRQGLVTDTGDILVTQLGDQIGTGTLGDIVAVQPEIGPEELRFYWVVNVAGTRLTWFRAGQDGGELGVDPHLQIALASDLECLIKKYAPAHTEVLFNYSGLTTPDPMAGTP